MSVNINANSADHQQLVGHSSTHSFTQLARLSNWHVESEAINRALATVIEAQAQLPMAKYW
ncbi:Tn3 family transposase, partial [uncultured Marivita sp.]|uniref:Tn3 family transposase n=1 Tax=uncultured Marivita sp. TaxID=888080 RepID=UPI0026003114